MSISRGWMIPDNAPVVTVLPPAPVIAMTPKLESRPVLPNIIG